MTAIPVFASFGYSTPPCTQGADAHGHSQSYKRYLFDLELLAQDEAELGDDHHVQYYIGATSFAALEALAGRGQHTITPEMLEVRCRVCSCALG